MGKRRIELDRPIKELWIEWRVWGRTIKDLARTVNAGKTTLQRRLREYEDLLQERGHIIYTRPVPRATEEQLERLGIKLLPNSTYAGRRGLGASRGDPSITHPPSPFSGWAYRQLFDHLHQLDIPDPEEMGEKDKRGFWRSVVRGIRRLFGQEA